MGQKKTVGTGTSWFCQVLLQDDRILQVILGGGWDNDFLFPTKKMVKGVATSFFWMAPSTNPASDFYMDVRDEIFTAMEGCCRFLLGFPSCNSNRTVPCSWENVTEQRNRTVPMWVNLFVNCLGEYPLHTSMVWDNLF